MAPQALNMKLIQRKKKQFHSYKSVYSHFKCIFHAISFAYCTRYNIFYDEHKMGPS